MRTAEGVVHLRSAGSSVLVDCVGPRMPRVLYWGADLGDIADADLQALARSDTRPVVPNSIDVPVAVGLVPEHGAGWLGRPGLLGHRRGRGWSPLFDVTAMTSTSSDAGEALEAVGEDAQAGLRLTLVLRLDPFGLLHLQATLTNVDQAEDYRLEGLSLGLPLPAAASEIVDFAGSWGRERVPQRMPVKVGSHVREGRRGRPGHDASLLLAVGEPSFGFRRGRVWAAHVAWSGNQRLAVERTSSGDTLLSGGELLLPGEVDLGPGESYQTPTMVAGAADGLDALAQRFHEFLRARPSHPSSPRPVVLNTWEAVYFDHDLGRLTELADAAASVGVERFVLDDGWFGSRRDDTSGLGDWVVAADVWPNGLHPLVEHVHRLGMQFGLWVEPEMVNPDSELARTHPEWMLQPSGRLPLESRHQQVLDLAQPGAYAHVRDQLVALLTEYRIEFLKWDHNRDLLDAGHGPAGLPGVHGQTLAVYRLLDEIRSLFPGLEIESCAGGGGRIDLGILARADRVWASDCIDPLERQCIQRWTMQLLPPELVGAHIGAPRSHTTGRRHDLAFRAGTALFGHLGIEWDITEATAEERSELRRWVDLYRQMRGLIHSGRVVRSDHADPDVWVHGVVGLDGTEALYAVVAVGLSKVVPPGHVRLPGLDPDTRYRVELCPPGDHIPLDVGLVPPGWVSDGGMTATGRALALHGVRAPLQHPETLLLLHVTALPREGTP